MKKHTPTSMSWETRGRSPAMAVAQAVLLLLYTGIACALSGGGMGNSGKDVMRNCANSGCHSTTSNDPYTVEPSDPFQAQTRFEDYDAVLLGGEKIHLPLQARKYRFITASTAQGGANATGFNVAASDGSLSVVNETEPGDCADASLAKSLIRRTGDGELTHCKPSPGAGRNWDFSYTAPDNIGKVTLFGCGNHGNGDGEADAGDDVHCSRFDILVNTPPIAADDRFSNATAVRLNSVNNRLDVLGNDADEDMATRGDELRIIRIEPESDTLSLAEGGEVVIYTPACGFIGTESFTYTIQDSLEVMHSASIEIETMGPPAADQIPVISSAPLLSATDAAEYRYQVSVSGTLNPSFELVTGPDGMAFSGQSGETGLLTWHPTIRTVGNFPVTIQVAGSCGVAAIQDWVITVTSPDSDNDGMPDSYENANGFNRDNPADANEDRDGDGRSNVEEFRQGGDPDADDIAPVVTAPGDQVVNSTGFLTAVNLGVAVATDGATTQLLATADQSGPFRPGRHEISWQAADAAGNRGSDTQRIDVLPIVDFDPGQVSGEGAVVNVGVRLNGDAAEYPVVLAYTVGGTAGVADSDAVAGSFTLQSGRSVSVPVNITADGSLEADEQIVFTLGALNNAVAGVRSTHTITVVDRNVPPQLEILTRQDGPANAQQQIIFRDRGSVSVSVLASDPNPGDTLTVSWAGTDSLLSPPLGNSSNFTINPATLPVGGYKLLATVTDAAGASTSDSRSILIVNAAPVLSTADDTDGDGISDANEGLADSDNDGVADYLDALNAGERLAIRARANSPAAQLETDNGLRITLGSVALQTGRGGAQLLTSELQPDSLRNAGGLFDFEVRGLSAGGVARVVIPLDSAIVPDSVYRKFDPRSGWYSFIETNTDGIATANPAANHCPGPSSISWRNGLRPFQRCVRLTLSDGGPNDADGSANGIIRDPGGPATQPTGDDLAPADSTKIGGGGAAGLWWLMLLLVVVGVHWRPRVML